MTTGQPGAPASSGVCADLAMAESAI